MTRILVVDDEPSMREFLSIALTRQGYQVETARDGVEALRAMEKETASAILTDLSMPRMGGMELLEEVHRRWPDAAVIIITAFGTIENAVKAMHLGARDYVSKPFNVEEILLKIERAIEGVRLEQENVHLKSELRERHGLEGIVGQCEEMQRIFRLVRQIAGTDSTALITGESGTGKELIARAIHVHSHRASGPFLSINCAAMPESLLESELFGHVKGAFTGAVSAKKGLFQAATGGTLVLDEIGDMPQAMQVKLLRVLQDGKVRPVGGTVEIATDVRIVATTNRDLEAMVAAGDFREDLFYRINVIPIHLPPLRARREDLPVLVEHFVQKFCAKMGKPVLRVDKDAMEVLEGYDWPGNVRELENVVERAVTLEQGGSISEESLPDRLTGRPGRDVLSEVVRDFFRWKEEGGEDVDEYIAGIHRRLIERALLEAEGNKTRAAELLGVSFRSLRYYAGKYEIDVP